MVRFGATARLPHSGFQRRPHALLIDLHLTDGGDGKVVIKMIQTSEDLQGTKVIGMSGKLTDGQAAQLTHQGFESALRKPFSVRQVIDAIEAAHAVVS